MPEIAPKKKFGENFLTDQTVLKQICVALKAAKQKVILVWINGTQFTNFTMDMEQQI